MATAGGQEAFDAAIAAMLDDARGWTVVFADSTTLRSVRPYGLGTEGIDRSETADLP